MNPTLLVLGFVAIYAFTKRNAVATNTAGGLGFAPKPATTPQPQQQPKSGGGGSPGFGSPGSGGQKTNTVSQQNFGDPFAPFISSAGGLDDGRINNPDDMPTVDAPDVGYIDFLTGASAAEGQALGDALALTPLPNVVLDPGTGDDGGGDVSSGSPDSSYQYADDSGDDFFF